VHNTRVDADVPVDFGIEPRRSVLQPIFGEGIFTQEGLHWKRSRNIIRGHLQHKQYDNLELFQGSVDNLLHTIQKGGGTVDLQPLLFRMTLDITTEFVFGESVRSLVAPENSIERRFADAFDIVQRRATGQLRSWNIRWIGDRQQYWQAWRDLTSITDQILDRNLKLSEESSNLTKQHEFLCAMAQTAGDRATLRGQVLNILAAGRDTTASLLSWTL
jgi:cytochrome P450